ncbi:MBL fold metallo-hydrolase [Methylobacterium nodulans]|uniref:Putative phytochrome sensor protein n=1 Tax=Methylobacterium nodulans (strain LMG 21967 / CNCM I-2342 / ORS 2060) TaxID=460265 RepID=B8IM22_METNO|nr:MBL fold metallo-hydrolase [Methylobacterium nodulans]ACL56366.1 putative phytochrome sensor protein [Methylobacterium nodulans ORS 2060]
MQVRFFGTRGSLPVPGPRTIRYGGNTSCVALRTARGTLVILDMGTGAYALGRELAAEGRPLRGHVLITHTHWDHIQGVPFFAPFFTPGNEWDIYAPRGLGASLRETLSGQMQYSYFPVALDQLGATIRYHELVEGELALGEDDDVAVETHYLNHPALTLGYRLTADGATLVYALDHEPFCTASADGEKAPEGQDRRHADFLQGADLVIHDAQYTAAEYPAKIGWGHSTVEYARRVALEAGAARLALMHHDPDRDDDSLDALVARYRVPDLDLFAAAEGQVIDLSAARIAAPAGARARSAREAVGSALAAQSVVIAAADPAAAAGITAILRGDGVGVHAAALTPDAVAQAVLRHRPALAVIANGPEPAGRLAEICAAVRALGAQGQDLPIVLVSRSGDRRGDEEIGISDRLVTPFTPSYARTRLRAWLMRTACRWARAAKPPGEAERLAALRRLDLLDTPPEERFDRIVALAARSFAVPFAALSLVDSDRQWFKASHGLTFREVPRDASLCAHAVAASDGGGCRDPLVVPDTLLDARFADSPAVVGPPHLRFYAGQPLILADGHCIGTLCIADTRPRVLDPEEERRLRWLAELALNEIAPRPAAVTGG